MRKLIYVFIFSISFLPDKLLSQTRWSFEFSGGAPVNIPFPVHIYQQGEPDIRIASAGFYSEPFPLPPYWDWRFSRSGQNGLWELEAIHHKLYLSNKPAEVQRFSISHGFNIFTVNRGWRIGAYIFRTGLGCVFSHPESEIRNKKFEDQGNFLNTIYYISGPVLNVGINRRWYIIDRFFVQSELKNTFSYARVPVADGHAEFFTSSFYITAGIGYDFINRTIRRK